MAKILVCGATGFIGRNIVERLAADPTHQITAQYHDRPPFDAPGIIWVQADLTDVTQVDKAVAGAQVIIQAAAITSGAADIVARPHIHITDNAVMNSLLFRAAHDHGVGHFIVFSCSILYLSNDEARSEEDFTGEVHLPYHGGAWNKIYFEKMAEFFGGLGRTRYTVLRHSNIFGPHDKYDPNRSHMFGATIHKVETTTTNEISVWGDGSETRDLLYVDDLMDAVEATLARQREPFALFNIGAGQPIRVRDVVQMIIEASGRDLRISYDTAKPTIPTHIHLDCQRAADVLGWTPKTSLKAGISKTLAWYRDAFSITKPS